MCVPWLGPCVHACVLWRVGVCVQWPPHMCVRVCFQPVEQAGAGVLVACGAAAAGMHFSCSTCCCLPCCHQGHFAKVMLCLAPLGFAAFITMSRVAAYKHDW